jgi:hypothetical protein
LLENFPFHPFSSFFILFLRKRQKKAEKGRDRLGYQVRKPFFSLKRLLVCCFVVLRSKTKGVKQKNSNKRIQTKEKAKIQRRDTSTKKIYTKKYKFYKIL